MKRFATSLIASLLAFTAGLVTASSWTSKSEATVEPATVQVAEPCPPPSQPNATVHAVEVPREFAFAEGPLKVVPEHVQLKSESHRYNIDVSYPQIVGTEEGRIRKVNQHLKQETTKLYQWALNPSKPGLPSIAGTSGTYNTVNFTYDVNLATDSFFSVSFIGYSYGVTDYPLQRNFALNYDLISGKPLKLTDIFKQGSKYLEFISRHSMDELSRWTGSDLIEKALAPVATNFENFWHVTSNGIVFSFPACRVRNCTDGVQTVDIDFSDLKPLLRPGIPGKFEITYP